ncbi:hypothetical protein V2J09_007801 [Rumex salicifolius]
MAGGASSCVGIDRTSSTEFEPRTLDFRQIQFAREAALYVLNTKSMEEAFQIFTQGLEPVTSAATMDDDYATEIEIEDFGEDEEDECDYFAGNQLYNTTSPTFRGVATAPF